MNDQNKQTTLSGGEKFVAINLLSKIGIIFIVASVIAFSAASEGHIPDLIRLVLVLAVGLIMAAAGELFRRKGSKTFASTMTFGGIIELMVCAPVGLFGLYVFDTAGMLIYSLIAAALIFLLSWRYRSQAFLIISMTSTLIPAISALVSDDREPNAFVLMIYPIFLIMTHFANAVIARKLRFTAANITGIGIAAIETILVALYPNSIGMDHLIAGGGGLMPRLLAMAFVICCMLCYTGGLLLNSLETDGKMTDGDLAGLCISQGIVIFSAWAIFLWEYERLTGVVLLVLALLYAFTAIIISLKFNWRLNTNTALINFILISATIALFALIDAENWQYIALHTFAAAVLIAGFFLERKLFKGWGIALTVIAEFNFFAVLSESGSQPESFKFSAVIINLILWFGIMAVLGTRKARDTLGYRLYSFAALLNAGLLFSNLISSDLMRLLNARHAFPSSAQRNAFACLLCAAVWMVLGFVAGKLPLFKKMKAAASMTHYGIGFICLISANFFNTFSNVRQKELVVMLVVATVIVNVVSVLAVLDITLQINELAAKFSRAVGLIVSGYAMISLTTILGTNNVVKFTSCIISIIYIVMAAAWIIIGFWKSNALLRRFGLALALFSSAKLFLFDFSGVDAFGRTILFIGFGVTLLGISFGYAIMEKRLSKREKERDPIDKTGEK